MLDTCTVKDQLHVLVCAINSNGNHLRADHKRMVTFYNYYYLWIVKTSVSIYTNNSLLMEINLDVSISCVYYKICMCVCVCL